MPLKRNFLIKMAVFVAPVNDFQTLQLFSVVRSPAKQSVHAHSALRSLTHVAVVRNTDVHVN